MSGIKTTTKELSSEVRKILEKYGNDVSTVTVAVVENAVKEAKNYLIDISPRRTGKYAEGWRTTKKQYTRLRVDAIIHNTTKPGVSHLLEHGHAKRNGGRTEGKHFIELVEDVTKRDLEENLRAAIGDV